MCYLDLWDLKELRTQQYNLYLRKKNQRHVVFHITLVKNLWFGLVDAFHRKESGYPLRDFTSRPDRAYKLEVQIMAYLFQDLQIGNPDNCLGKGGILRPVLS